MTVVALNHFRYAEAADAAAIAALINLAKHGDGGGWTNESQLLAGDRTSRTEIEALFAAPAASFIVCEDDAGLCGCAYLNTAGVEAYLGLLAVRPALQGGGVGKRLMTEVERVARDQWRCTTMLITVITTHRPELTAYYERRGYVRTGRYKALERQGALDNMKVGGLRLEWMSKILGEL